ncbi:MAG: outer membrane beta-barrel protein [Bdellovibrionota bacterium]
MKRIIFSSTLLLALLFTASPAHAMRFSLVGAANMSEPKVAGTEYTAANGFGYGGLLEFGIMPFFTMELGALSLPRKYEYGTVVPVAGHTTVRLKMLEVPLVFKAYLGHALSLGVGGYYAKYKGDITYETTDAFGQTSITSKTLAEANHSASDYGLVTSVGLYFPLAPLTRIIVDGRYTLGIKDNNIGAGTTTYNDLQVLAGIRFSF